MWGIYLERVRTAAPMIHNITNYVTANDVANLLLACGARPVMADEPEEVEEIAARCGGLHLNLGTISRRTIPSMRAAGSAAARRGRPIVLDPVGVGASALRRQTARELLAALPITAVRCNLSELLALALPGAESDGVDARPEDGMDEDGLLRRAELVTGIARRLGVVAAVTGAIDLVSDGTHCFAVRNGCPEMSRVTGTGCQLSALTAAFLSQETEHVLEAAAAAVAAMGLAGETAKARLEPWEGNAALRGRMIDAVYRMNGTDLERGARIEQLG